MSIDQLGLGKNQSLTSYDISKTYDNIYGKFDMNHETYGLRGMT